MTGGKDMLLQQLRHAKEFLSIVPGEELEKTQKAAEILKDSSFAPLVL